jgi:hypothetical protein
MVTLNEFDYSFSREYEKDPEGWQIYFALDKEKYPTFYYHHYEEVWIMKLTSFFGQQCEVAKGKLDDDEYAKLQDWIENPKSYGLRTVSKHTYDRIIEAFKNKPITEKEAMERRQEGKVDSMFLGTFHSEIPYEGPMPKSQQQLDLMLQGRLTRLDSFMFH